MTNYIGNRPANIPISASDVPDLPTSKITTGTFADARISNSSVSQFASTFDDNKIVNDISTLGLRVHTQENLIASNTSSASFDTFQDSSGVTNLTNAVRSSQEFIFSGSVGSLASYDYNGASPKAKVKWNNMASDNGTYWEIDNDGDSGYADSKYIIPSVALSPASGGYPTYSPGNVNSSTYFIYDFGSALNFTGGKYDIGKQNTWGDVNEFKFEYSLDDSSYSNVDLSNITQTGIQYSSTNNGSTASGGNISAGSSNGTASLSAHPTGYLFTSIVTFSGVPSITARYFKLTINSTHGGTSNNNIGFGQFAPHFAPTVASATGSFESNAITVSSTSSMGAVITYQDASGTNALNTDIIMKLSADNGSNYSTATLTALPDFATGIKMAKVNDLSVTAGTQLKYKIEFANQSSGSKEARIRGVSLQY